MGLHRRGRIYRIPSHRATWHPQKVPGRAVPLPIVRLILCDSDGVTSSVILWLRITYTKADLASWRIHRECVCMRGMIGRYTTYDIGITRATIDGQYPRGKRAFMPGLHRSLLTVRINIERIRPTMYIDCLPRTADLHGHRSIIRIASRHTADSINIGHINGF